MMVSGTRILKMSILCILLFLQSLYTCIYVCASVYGCMCVFMCSMFIGMCVKHMCICVVYGCVYVCMCLYVHLVLSAERS